MNRRITSADTHSCARRAAVLVSTAVAAALVVALNPSAALAASSQASCATSQYSSNESCPLTGDLAEKEAAKEKLAREHMQQSVSANGVTPYVHKGLAEPYYLQSAEWWCGPATVVMIADYLGLDWPHDTTQDQVRQQNDAKNRLGTTQASGTWFDTHGVGVLDNVPDYPNHDLYKYYPVADVLNHRLYRFDGHLWYNPAPLPGAPTVAQQQQFAANLKYDIDNGYPEADNQWSPPGGPHNNYTSYQPDEAIQHWWSGRGYTHSGGYVGINDPAHWSLRQEHFVQTEGSSSHDVATSLGGRGYIW